MAALLQPVFGTWHRRRQPSATQGASVCAPRAETDVASADGSIDVAAQARAVIDGLAPRAASRSVDMQMAVQPGLSLKTSVAAFRAGLHDILAAAIDRADSGVLLTATRQGADTEIVVLDDGSGAASADGTEIEASAVAAFPHARLEAVPSATGCRIRLLLPNVSG